MGMTNRSSKALPQSLSGIHTNRSRRLLAYQPKVLSQEVVCTAVRTLSIPVGTWANSRAEANARTL
eukprot:scaffold603_cov404-Prasinococcus_capsulatus_cf.AAC.64